MAEKGHASAYPLVDVASIEKELVRLWREMGASQKTMARARVLSLVVVAEEKEEARISEQLAQLVQRHPARTILLLLGDEGEAEHFDAGVTLLCGLNQRSLCTEQVTLHAAGIGRKRLVGAVRALLTSDLPVVLWWTASPLVDAPLVGWLAALADRVVLDTGSLDRIEQLTELPAAWFKGQTTDLAWSRLTSWRELVAVAFDPPLSRDYLAKLEEVTVETGRGGIAGWLLVGWLASRLGWKVQGATPDGLRFSHPQGGEVVGRVIVGDGERAIESVTLSGGSALFRATRQNDGTAESSLRLPDVAPLQQLVHLGDERAVALVSRELDLMARDRVFEGALAIVRQGLEAGE